MSERVYITKTGERVRNRGGLVEVGLSPEAQDAFGTLLHFRPLKIGACVKEGHHLFVIEGTLSAAEFYAPVSGRVISCASSGALISDWLVTLEKMQLHAGKVGRFLG